METSIDASQGIPLFVFQTTERETQLRTGRMIMAVKTNQEGGI
jgi:hypothetical protein